MSDDAMEYKEPLKVKPVERFSSSQIEAVHRASMNLLAETGISCAGRTASEVYRAGGCRVEEIKKESRTHWQVYFPTQLVEEILNQVPSRVVLGARDPKNTLLLDAPSPSVYFGTGSEANVYLRSQLKQFSAEGGHTMQYPVFTEEPGTIRALCESAHLMQQLDQVDFFIRNVNIRDEEVTPENKDVNVFFASLLHTSKHVQGGLTDPEALPAVIRMAQLIGGDQEHLPVSFIVCPIKSPLSMVADSSEKVIAIARQKVPMVISSSPQGGSTAPIQEEGMTAQINAEILAGIVLAQLAGPGAPVLYGSVPVRARLDTLHDCYGAPEFVRYAMDCAQMARWYGIPCYSSAGVGDAKRPGMQATAEKLYSYLGTASAGAQYIHYAFGLLAGTNIFSPLQAVLDNASVRLAKNILGTADFDEEAVDGAVGEIETAAAGSGMFVRGIRRQLRKNRVSHPYEFVSEDEEDRVFAMAQQKLDSYLAQEAEGLSEAVIRQVRGQIPGLLPIETWKGGSL